MKVLSRSRLQGSFELTRMPGLSPTWVLWWDCNEQRRCLPSRHAGFQPSVSCAFVLVSRPPPGSWTQDTILDPVSKLRPDFNPQLPTYSDKTRASCCPCYVFPPQGFFLGICSQSSLLPPRNLPGIASALLHCHAQPRCRGSSSFF